MADDIPCVASAQFDMQRGERKCERPEPETGRLESAVTAPGVTASTTHLHCHRLLITPSPQFHRVHNNDAESEVRREITFGPLSI